MMKGVKTPQVEQYRFQLAVTIDATKVKNNHAEPIIIQILTQKIFYLAEGTKISSDRSGDRGAIQTIEGQEFVASEWHRNRLECG